MSFGRPLKGHCSLSALTFPKVASSFGRALFLTPQSSHSFSRNVEKDGLRELQASFFSQEKGCGFLVHTRECFFAPFCLLSRERLPLRFEFDHGNKSILRPLSFNGSFFQSGGANPSKLLNYWPLAVKKLFIIALTHIRPNFLSVLWFVRAPWTFWTCPIFRPTHPSLNVWHWVLAWINNERFRQEWLIIEFREMLTFMRLGVFWSFFWRVFHLTILKLIGCTCGSPFEFLDWGFVGSSPHCLNRCKSPPVCKASSWFETAPTPLDLAASVLFNSIFIVCGSPPTFLTTLQLNWTSPDVCEQVGQTQLSNPVSSAR